ncbi:MAG: hypothetical protein IT203_10150 [Fimbriimonadaceae bacterium]|nr:hypothetical protein [Fimbriimonadaceae bacterium]
MTDDDNLIDKEKNVDEDELDRRIRELGLDQTPSIEKAREEAAKIDEEFGERLKALEEKAKTVKEVRDNQSREKTRRLESDRETAKGLGLGLSIAYTIIGLPILGAVVGWFLDSRVGGQTFTSLGVLLGSVLGIVAAVFMISRANNA